MTGTYIGIDIGGSGGRIVIQGEAQPTPLRLDTDEWLSIRGAGSDLADRAAVLVTAARRRWPEICQDISGVGLSATGLATLFADPGAVAPIIRSVLGDDTVPVIAVIDAVAAHAAALAGAPGVVCALGTGAITLGTDWSDTWRRGDGWGHLFGDRGGGAWIGIRALTTALRTFDGIDSRGSALLAAATQRFGAPLDWPAQFYTRDDRAGVLASLVPDVIACADAGDPAAAQILGEAGAQAAETTLAVLGADLPPTVAITGAIFGDDRVRTSFTATLRAARPGVTVTQAGGDPVDGALFLAARARSLATRPPFLWTITDQGAVEGRP